MIHSGKASSFADPGDIAAFRKCKATGGSDKHCFSFGDNGIGFFGDDTTEGSGPSCALIPEDMKDEWGSINNAHMQEVSVKIGDASVICKVKDTLPHRSYQEIHNGAIIDLNLDACLALGLTPPVMEDATWESISPDTTTQTES